MTKRRNNIEKHKEAARIRQRRSREKLREMIRSVKQEKGCSDCPETHPACLQFHHLDEKTKVASINRAIAGQLRNGKLLAEMNKCIVLCANCHAKRHWRDRQIADLSQERRAPSFSNTNTQSESKSGGERWPVRKAKREPSVCSVHIPVSVGPVARATGGRARSTTINSNSSRTDPRVAPHDLAIGDCRRVRKYAATL